MISIKYAWSIWLSFDLLCGSMMVMCERRLQITSPIWDHRAAPLSNNEDEE
jgi:hypothetical protein